MVWPPVGYRKSHWTRIHSTTRDYWHHCHYRHILNIIRLVGIIQWGIIRVQTQGLVWELSIHEIGTSTWSTKNRAQWRLDLCLLQPLLVEDTPINLVERLHLFSYLEQILFNPEFSIVILIFV